MEVERTENGKIALEFNTRQIRHCVYYFVDQRKHGYCGTFYFVALLQVFLQVSQELRDVK